MRLLAILSCVAASAAGCDTLRCGSLCGSSKSKACVPATTCPPAPAFVPKTGTPPIPPAKQPTLQPTHLPTLQEVRGPEATELRGQRPAVAPNANGDVLLIPRLVYVPYSPYSPTAPAGTVSPPAAMSPYMQAGERMTVLPPMGAPALSHTETVEECLQQMKALNARISELEARNAGHAEPAAPAMLPAPPVR